MRRQNKAEIQIQEYYLSSKKITLSPTVEKMRVRMLAAHDLLSKFETKTSIVKILSNRFEGISERTIYNDISAAEKLFGELLAPNKEYLRAALIEGYTAVLKEAIIKKDYDRIESIGYRIEKAAKLHHAEEEEKVDLSKRQLVPMEIGSDVATLEEQRRRALEEYAEDAEIVD